MTPRRDWTKSFLKADTERGFIQAYYRYVRKWRVQLDGPDRDGRPFVAWAVGDSLACAMDFSSGYEFPEERRPAKTAQRMREKVEDLRRWAQVWTRKEDPEYVYEIWCFIPPKKVLHAYEQAVSEGLPVRLIPQDEVQRRLRETVLALPAKVDLEEDTAFAVTAVLVRDAFNLTNAFKNWRGNSHP